VSRIEWPPLRISVEDFSKIQPNDIISPTIRRGSILPNGFRRLGVRLFQGLLVTLERRLAADHPHPRLGAANRMTPVQAGSPV